jgi:hypothetical protein
VLAGLPGRRDLGLGQGGGQVAGAAEQPGQGDRVHIVVVADDLAVVTARITDLVSDARARADADDPGEAFFGFLARVAGEAAAKRDLPHAISVAGSLREDLFAALNLLLRRAQQAGAVRAGIVTSDLIVLLKGMFAGLAGSTDPAVHERVFAVLADGLRARADRRLCACAPGR